MNAKNEAAGAAKQNNRCKDSKTFSNKVLTVLKSEKKTAIELNQLLVFNDARKMISILRRDGYDIADYRLSDLRKVYYLKNIMP